MKTVVRIKDIDIKNIKNVRHGKITTNTNFDRVDVADIVGFYGQNGSGKTAVVEAMSLLKNLLVTNELPEKSKHLITLGDDSMALYFKFLVINKFGEYTVEYSSLLETDENRLKIINEKVSYKENIKRRQFKDIVIKEGDKILIRNKPLHLIAQDLRLKIMLSNELSTLNHTGFIFRNELKEVLENTLNEEEFEILKNLVIDFNNNFHIIDNEQNGLILANIMMPFSVHLKNIRGKIPYGLNEPMVLPLGMYNDIKKVIEQINSVIYSIIPGLKVVVNPINKEITEDSELGVRFEFLSKKNGVKLPLRCESDGTLKLISILSTLIAVFNNANACVVIDELDSSVFEYLLGEILEVIGMRGRGQLFFTSHNLRILEVLKNKDLWFTTINENNRYIQLKGVKPLNNLRDIYIRAVQLGGQDEELYSETDQYNIKKAFRKAGKLNV